MSVAAVNPKGTKTLVAKSVNTFFINGKSAVTNGLRILRSPSFHVLIFLIAPYNNTIPLFSMYLITFATSFIALFVSVIPELISSPYDCVFLNILATFTILLNLSSDTLLNKSYIILIPLFVAFTEFNKIGKYPRNCIILDSWVFEKFILADEPFAQALRIFKICVLVNNNLSGNLVSSLELPTTFDGRFKIALVSFFVLDFNFLSHELDSFTFKMSYWVILY